MLTDKEVNRQRNKQTKEQANREKEKGQREHMIGKRQYALLQTDFYLTKNLQGKFKILNNSVFGSDSLCRD